MSSKIGVAYAVVAATVGHVVICFKGADYAVRGIEKLAAHIESRRIARASARSQTPVVLDGEFKVMAK